MVVDHRGAATPVGSSSRAGAACATCRPDLDLLLRYADALAKLGRVRESLHAFYRAAHLAAPQQHGQHGVAAERLRPLATALLDQVTGIAAGGGGFGSPNDARSVSLRAAS